MGRWMMIDSELNGAILDKNVLEHRFNHITLFGPTAKSNIQSLPPSAPTYLLQLISHYPPACSFPSTVPEPRMHTALPATPPSSTDGNLSLPPWRSSNPLFPMP